MTILGIDPGIGRMGWGVIEENGNKLSALDFGCLETNPKDSVENRLLEIYKFVGGLINKYRPDALSIEELFFGSNSKTAFSVGQARGVVILCGAVNKVKVFSYTPLQVKIALTGYGRAEKGQIGQMVRVILRLPSTPTPDDTSDALAVALTHSFSAKFNKLSGK